MVRKQTFGTSFSQSMKDEILIRDNYTCVYCGASGIEVDHVIPRSKGGITSYGNGVTTCIRCNRKKKGSLLISYITRGLFYLSTKGVNTDWVDGLYAMREPEKQICADETKYDEHYEECKKAVRILLQCDISRSEICSILRIDEETMDEIMEEIL